MSFLDENITINLKKGDKLPDNIPDGAQVNYMEEDLDPVGKEDDDINNDGKVDSSDKYLANKRKAIAKAILKSKKTIKKEDLEEGKLANVLGGAAVLAGLFLNSQINSSDKVVQRLKAEYEKAEGNEAAQDSIQDLLTKRLIMLDTGKFDDSTPMKESIKVGLSQTLADFISGEKISLKRALRNIFNLNIEDTEDKRFIESNINIIKAGKEPFKKGSSNEKEFFALLKRYNTPKENIEDIKKTLKIIRSKMNEDKEEKFDYKAPKDKDKDDIRIDPDTEFKVDLNHLIQKHMKEGKSREDVIKITKALMAKLHNKGKVEIDGTTLLFKEADLDIRDMQMSLPQPDAPDYLGDDGMDYEGGMAKSQMLKMKKYAVALCDMIEDESQLESWVQAKLTKASDYMSSVFHYLDYQRSKMNETIHPNPADIEFDDIDPHDENRPDYKAGTIYGTDSKGNKVAADGYFSEFEGYVATGDIELI